MGDKMIGWHHQLDGHEFQQPQGVLESMGSQRVGLSDRTEVNDYTTKQIILLKDIFFLKLCTHDYIPTMYPVGGHVSP